MDMKTAVIYRLEEVIRQKDITVNEAAIRSGVPPSTLKNILYVAKIVVAISQKEKKYGTTYHIINPQSISFEEAILIAKAFKISLSPMEFKQWIERLRIFKDTLPITPFKEFFDEKYWNKNKELIFSTEKISAMLKKLDIHVHPMTPELINKYYSYIKMQNHINECYEDGIID